MAHSNEDATGIQVHLTERPLFRRFVYPLDVEAENETYDDAWLPLFPGQVMYARALAEAGQRPSLWNEDLCYMQDSELASLSIHIAEEAVRQASEPSSAPAPASPDVLAECPRAPLLVHYDGIAQGPYQWDVMRLLLPTHADYERIYLQQVDANLLNPEFCMPYATPELVLATCAAQLGLRAAEDDRLAPGDEDDTVDRIWWQGRAPGGA